MNKTTGAEVDSAEAADFAAAAAALAAHEGIVKALGPLAASPLSEAAADRMRRALDRSASPRVRSAMRQLADTPSRPTLVSVPDAPTQADGVDRA